jgi:hypothetical protein
MSMDENPIPIEAKIDIDLNRIIQIAQIGIKRAIVFFRIGLDDIDKRGLGDFKVGTAMSYNFIPDDINAEDRYSLREEFQYWLIGSCLKELDLFYGIFLDEVWRTIEMGERHRTLVRSDHVFGGSFHTKTNVSDKQKLVVEKLAIEDHHEALYSLSLARNSLTHNAGVVRAPRDCNNSSRDTLQIKWYGFETVASRGGIDRIFNGTVIDTNELPGEGETTILVRLVVRSIEVPSGCKIELSADHLAELCMFYTIISSKVLEGLTKFLSSAGIEFPDASSKLDIDLNEKTSR